VRAGETSAAGAGAPSPVEVVHRPRLLLLRFAERQRFLSWAIHRGGRAEGREIAIVQVEDAELAPPADPRVLLARRLADAGAPAAVGLLTSRDVSARVVAEAAGGGLAVRCLATVGLGNALRAGDPPGPGHPGTINLIVHVAAPLSGEALVEALAIAVEARTLAVREGSVRSFLTGAPATGTGTDCVVVACPDAGEGLAYAGKHTEVGHLVGAATLDAVRRGIDGWMRENGAGERT
jgi:adenosylcobinamide amidohydrolase